tara:strand:- start:7901 stop:12517 length:4617 start_codon:yes stop_codon:yes gene_type:complete
MAIITDISSEQIFKLDSVTSKVIPKTFGRNEDIVELHIYDINNNLLYSEDDFTDYTLNEIEDKNTSTPLIATTKEPKIVNPRAKGAGEREYIPGPNGSREGYYFNTGEQMVWVTAKESPSVGEKTEESPTFQIDPIRILNDRSYTAGKYKIKLNIQRNKIFKRGDNLFNIKEISPSRREIRSIIPNIENNSFDKSINLFISEIETSSYFKDIILNFGNDLNFIGINVLLNKNPNKHELLIKLLEPLSSLITTKSTFKVSELIIDPITVTVDLGEPEFVNDADVIPLQGPNFKINVRENNSMPSNYKNYNELLNYSVTSSYQHLLNQLENKEIPQVNYDYIRPISSSTETIDVPYHFENFVHFGSAFDRLKNFEYKLGLIELYNRQIGEIESITSTIPQVALNNKETINDKKEKLIKGLDGYEQFLYYETGSNIFTWPKHTPTNTGSLLRSVTSSEALTWLGSENSNNSYYGGQLLSASLFDFGNEYGLINLVPKHIVDNEDNSFYKTFTHMIGHHFDHIWTHIKHTTEINDTHHKRGVSKDLVYFTLKSLGLETFDQFENANLIEYILGEGTTGSLYYDTPVSQSLVTTSTKSIPKGDITKEIWKRLYHNAPYLLKTKGTERGLRALMSCYGVPSTVLNVKEYGGPVKDKTKYKCFSYDKSSLALHGSSSENGYFLKTAWSSSFTAERTITNKDDQNAKTVTFRIKPTRSNNQYHLFSLSGSGQNINRTVYDTHLVLTPYVGNDISSSGDSIQYGKLDLYTASALIASTGNFPIYNGDFWNIFMGREVDTSKTYDGFIDNYYKGTLKFGAYQSNHLKSITYHTSSFDIVGINTGITKFVWGNDNAAAFSEGATFAYFCGIEKNSSTHYSLVNTLTYTGSLQEVRYYFASASTDILNPKTLEIQALDPFIYAGNTTSSAYDELIFRAPLGSNLVCETDQTIDSSSSHPNFNIHYIPTASISSSISGMKYKEVLEVHHLPTPDTVGISMTSEKVRMDEGSIDDDILSITRKSEVSILDRQPQDFEDLGVFFSPQTEINEHIIYNMGAFRLDDFIGSPLPSAQTASLYTDLKHLRDDYFKRVPNRFNYWDYIKTIQYIDHTLFKLIEQWVPMKANLKTGLLIEPHYLERTKFARELPVIDDGQTMISGSYNTIHADVKGEAADEIYSFMGPKYDRIPKSGVQNRSTVGGGNVITTNNFRKLPGRTYTGTTGSLGSRGTNVDREAHQLLLDNNLRRIEQGTNTIIDVNSYILDEEQQAAQAPIKPFDSRPKAQLVTISFSGVLVTSNQFNCKVNGDSISTITFASSHSNTMNLIATELKTFGVIADCTVNGNDLEITGILSNGNSLDNLKIFITNATLTGGASQATITITTTQEAKRSGAPVKYIPYESSVLLGNVVKGRKSNIYFNAIRHTNNTPFTPFVQTTIITFNTALTSGNTFNCIITDDHPIFPAALAISATAFATNHDTTMALIAAKFVALTNTNLPGPPITGAGGQSIIDDVTISGNTLTLTGPRPFTVTSAAITGGTSVTVTSTSIQKGILVF